MQSFKVKEIDNVKCLSCITYKPPQERKNVLNVTLSTKTRQSFLHGHWKEATELLSGLPVLIIICLEI